MALVSETAEWGVCINSRNSVTPGYVSHEICLGPISLFHVFGLWGTAWKFTKTADNVRTTGRCETRFLCYVVSLPEGINHLTNVFLLQMLALDLLLCLWPVTENGFIGTNFTSFAGSELFDTLSWTVVDEFMYESGSVFRVVWLN